MEFVKYGLATKREGEEAYSPQYSKCGRKTSYDSSIRDRVSAIRDNDQRASYVYSKLLVKYPDEKIPSIRTIQRWWVESKENRPKGRPRSEVKKSGQKPLMKHGK